MPSLLSQKVLRPETPLYEFRQRARLLVLYTGRDTRTLHATSSRRQTQQTLSKAAFEKHGKIYAKKVHAELEALLTGPPEDVVVKPAAIHKGVRTKPRNRSIVAGREPLGLFEPNGPHFPQGA